MDKTLNMALVGASGVVGKKILQLLEKKGIKVDKLFPLGSSTVGQTVHFQNQDYVIGSLDDFDPTDANITIFSAGGSVAKQYARKFVEAGNYVIDLSSEFRYEDDVPLIIPEINGNIVENLDEPTLIANPNCSTSQLLMVLKPIHEQFGIEFLNIATYQAVSGTGKEAVEELRSQTYESDTAESKVYPKPIAFNVIPQCDIFLDNAFTKEEMKLVWETHKILDSNIHVAATCVRVPVLNGHSESIHILTEKPLTEDVVVKLLSNSPGLKLHYDLGANDYPTAATDADGDYLVHVGRLRKDLWDDCRMNMWVVADNLLKGAALNSIQIANLIFD